jgi:tetratricopeptide (TPR) repeat protein
VEETAKQAARWLAALLLLVVLTVVGPHPDSRARVSAILPSVAASEAPLQPPSPVPVAAALSLDRPNPPTAPVEASARTRDVSSHHARRPIEPKHDAEAEDAESALLASALQRLHREHDASGTLLMLESYPSRFPHGQLAGEVALVEAEALLKLGRREELVERLDPSRIGRFPRASELLLLRAEALAKLGRYSEASAAFSELLDGPLEREPRERALYGRALCRMELGRADGAREDLALLMAEFPSEKPKVMRALQSLEP